jgi:hypothetical protein
MVYNRIKIQESTSMPEEMQELNKMVVSGMAQVSSVEIEEGSFGTFHLK